MGLDVFYDVTHDAFYISLVVYIFFNLGLFVWSLKLLKPKLKYIYKDKSLTNRRMLPAMQKRKYIKELMN